MNELKKENSGSFTWVGLLFFCLTILTLSSCAKQRNKEEMNFEELSSKTTAFLEKKKYDNAAEMLEEIIARFPDRDNIHHYKLLLADTYFKLNKHASACQMYDHYNNYYPSDEKAEYAKYQAVLSQFYQTLRTDCDQTPTEETIKLCSSYLQNKDYNKYRKDIQDILNTCEHKLFNKEIYVFNFYLKQGKYDSARNRLNYIKNNFLTKKQSIEPQILFLECKLAQKENNRQSMQSYLEKLSLKYPESQYTRMSQTLAKRANVDFEF